VGYLERVDLWSAEAPRASAVQPGADLFLGRACGQESGHRVNDAPLCIRARQRHDRFLEKNATASVRWVDWGPWNNVFLAAVRDGGKPWRRVVATQERQNRRLRALVHAVVFGAYFQQVRVHAECVRRFAGHGPYTGLAYVRRVRRAHAVLTCKIRALPGGPRSAMSAYGATHPTRTTVRDAVVHRRTVDVRVEKL
jgi:hypothetical protein